MRTIEEAVAIIQNHITVKKACFAIVSDGGNTDESSLMSTRDGFLNLALSILEFVAAVDRGAIEMDDKHAFWSDTIKSTMYQLPVHGETFLVGKYLFQDHASFLHAMNAFLKEVLPDGYKLENDPNFDDPSKNNGEGEV